MIQMSITLSIFLYCIGIQMYIYNGNKNLIYILISLEVQLLAIGLLFLQISFLLDDMLGSLITLYILPLAGAESALGLGLLISYYPQRGTLITK